MLLPRCWEQDAWVHGGVLGGGCSPPGGRLPCARPCPPPLSGHPASQHSFRLGSVEAPTWSPLGVPPPPNSAFLDRGTFVWGLDGEQGAIEWLAEDWGHGEGQGQERGGSALATSWTPGDPQHPRGGGEEARRPQASERVLLGVCKAGQGKGIWGRLREVGAGRGTPLLIREGQALLVQIHALC